MFLLAATRLILEKNNNHILAIFCIIFPKIDIISDAIIAIAEMLKFFSTNFFVTLQSMTVPYFMSKAFFYQDLCMGGEEGCTMRPPSPRDIIRQQYPGADRAKK